MFPNISPKQSFPDLEVAIAQYWREHQTFKKSIDSRPIDNPYRFYDGPPFITGNPHYGTLLSSVVKDVVGRYWTMRGKRVERVWGWDCHGLPIEEKVQKKLGINSNKEVEQVGVKKFIDECYAYTSTTSAEWDWYIDRLGRWVDMDRAYRTMDQDYMESVMWVFSELFRKGLIYEGKRVSLYSWKLGTPISNFEVAMDDSYQEVNDPAITVKFPVKYRDCAVVHIKDQEGRLLLGWSYKYDGWHFPAGSLEQGETIEECARRETLEETGLLVTHLEQIQQEVQFDRGSAWRATHFIATVSNIGELCNVESKKFREWRFLSRAELGDLSSVYIVDREAVEVFFGEHARTPVAAPISILAWTTTPWTMPAHMALAVGPEIDYVHVDCAWEGYIVARNRFETVFKGREGATIVRSVLAKDIIGSEYYAPFPEYYQNSIESTKSHRVYAADFITDTDGTGIGHEAPEFGEVDFQLAKREGIHISNAMDEAGRYTSEIGAQDTRVYADGLSTLEWLHYQDANAIMIARLAEKWLLFKKEGITHRVPFCPRSGTPLVQKAQKSWFIDIANNKDRLKEANEQINWFPEYLKHGRFAKGIDTAPDWCISRTRYWGAPMPVWRSADASETVVVSSREEIFELNKSYGQLEARTIDGKIKYFFKGGEYDGIELNLHKPYIDAIKLRSPKTGEELTRIPEVLDVWMDSGSMPYAQMHYPFENQVAMESSFPADFIAEYVGQVRAWFYVMHVLGVLLNPTNKELPTPSFTNVITTGVVMGSDGRKMSKSFGNYPDPRLTLEKYGADPIRFYMLNSPLLSGGDMDFKEEGIVETIKSVMLPLWNTYSFFTTYANIDGWKPATGYIDYMRHAETDLNVATVSPDEERHISGGLNDHELTENGVTQAHTRGRELRDRGVQYDVIVTTGLKRTTHTADIIAQEIGFTGERVVMEWLRERMVSDAFEGHTWAEAALEYERIRGVKPAFASMHMLSEIEGAETTEALAARTAAAIEEIRVRYVGKKVLIVAHGNVFRLVYAHVAGLPIAETQEDRRFRLGNTECVRLPNIPVSSPLDRWVLGELSTLQARVTDSYERYDLQVGARALVEFLGNLTNWYVRRSRKRFWGTGSWNAGDTAASADKSSAYETLYTVLTEVCKIAAPMIPFITESVYQGLTGRESVHLEYASTFNRLAVDRTLLADMAQVQELVTLGLALRSRKKLRVRQPLASVTIEKQLDPYFVEILREELNVKSVIMGADMSAVARQVCRPNAKLIGPRLGRSVQEVITAAKSGAFTLQGDWSVAVSISSGTVSLSAWEFELVYEPVAADADVEGNGGLVLMMDCEVTEELKLEWVARDLVRAIQDMRKEARYEVIDRISVSLKGDLAVRVIELYALMIAEDTLADSVSHELDGGVDIDREIEVEGGVIRVGVRRV